MLAFALVLRVLVERHEFRLWLALTALTIDLALASIVFLVVQALPPPPGERHDPYFVIYIIGPSLLMQLLLNALRNSVVGAVVGAAAAPVVFVAGTVPLAGFHPAEIVVCGILLLTGGGSSSP